MTAAQVIDRTRQYITENFLYMRRDIVLGEDDSLLERGIIDSMGVMDVLGFIDETFGVTPADDEVTEANLGSPRAIARFVAGKLRAPQNT